MKKVLFLGLAIVLCFSLVACGEKKTEESTITPGVRLNTDEELIDDTIVNDIPEDEDFEEEEMLEEDEDTEEVEEESGEEFNEPVEDDGTEIMPEEEE